MYKEKTDNERYLEQQLEDAQAQIERERKDRMEEMDRRRKETKEQRDEMYRTADSWPEALRKQSHLFANEASYGGEVDEFFDSGAKACNRALEIWGQVAKTKVEGRQRLQALLEQIDKDIRREVADHLDREGETPGWKQVVSALRDDETDPSAWLNW